MSESPKYWVDLVVREIRQATGRRYPELEKQLEAMGTPALREFHRFMQDIGTEMMLARKHRMWPGGPRI